MQQIWMIIANTPIWVWPLLVGLLILGAVQLATRSLPWRALLGLPLALGFLSLASLFNFGIPGWPGVAAWIAALLIGAAVGAVLAPRNLRYDPATRLVRVPGSVVPLLIIVAIFVGRYYFGYLFARYPELRTDQTTLLASVAFGGFCAGVMGGRLLGMWRRTRAG